MEHLESQGKVENIKISCRKQDFSQQGTMQNCHPEAPLTSTENTFCAKKTHDLLCSLASLFPPTFNACETVPGTQKAATKSHCGGGCGF